MDRDLLEKNYKKINDQLFYIGCKKSKIKKEIYSLYDLYLTIIRSQLQNYIGEAIKALLNVSGNGISVKDKKTIIFIKNDLKNIVNDILPFLTIEQLSIKKEYKIANRIKNNREFKSNLNLKDEVYKINNLHTNYTNNSIDYRNFYYENLFNENSSKNINIENFVLNKSSDNFKHDESLGCIDSTTLLSDLEEDKFSLNMHINYNSNYFIPIEFKDIILWIDTLDSSLNLYLQDLSIKINNEIFKRNILKKFINNKLLLDIFDNHLLFNNPSPFVLTYDPSLIQYIISDENYNEKVSSRTNLININTAELEFININLSMLKNKLFELKSNIYLLIKKENYWCSKLKLNSNNKSTIKK